MILKNERKLLSVLMGSSAMLIAAGVMPQTAQAQQQDETTEESSTPVAEEKSLEEVIVTGSRIRRSPLTSPTPLTIIDSQAVTLSGENNLADFLNELPALQGSLVPSQQTGASLGLAGLNLLNLRDLGSVRTLTLVDGRRHVGADPGSTAVDIGSIPFALVERIEVITGGASAVYGADAVSGVVNFIMRDDFQGLILDGFYGLNENGSGENYRISAVAGGNFADGRGNATVSAEWRDTNGLIESDLDYFRKNRSIIRVSRAPLSPDGTRPAQGIPTHELFFDVGSIQISDGGNVRELLGARQDLIFTENGLKITDTGPFGRLGANVTPTSNSVVGGDGFKNDQFTGSLTPSNQTYTITGSVDYRINDFANFFLDTKYSNSKSKFGFQPAFTFGFIGPTDFRNSGDIVTSSTAPLLFLADPTGVANAIDPRIGFDFDVGLDNPFLSSADVGLIEGTLPLSIGQITRFNFDLGERVQDTERQLSRIVTGIEGDFEVNDLFGTWNYDLSFNYGRSTLSTIQTGIPIMQRYAASVDAIAVTDDILANLDSADQLLSAATGEVILAPDAQAGDIICRSLAQERVGQESGVTPLGYEGCIPTNIFGPNAINAAARDFINAQVLESSSLEQVTINLNVAGQLGDYWGAGQIGFAAGYEYRDESAQANNDALPVLVDVFANAQVGVGGSFDVHEGYFELVVPVITDMPFIQDLTVDGAVRISDYSTIGSTTTWRTGLNWTPIEDIRFRGTYSQAIRAPNVSELFQPLSQTFSVIVDPCDVNNIENDASVAENRRRNCAALGISPTFEDPNPNVSKPGFLGGNTNVNEEKSKSYTIGTVITPRWIPELSIVLDWFDIKINDAISFLSAQSIVDNCVESATLDPNFCNLITRASTGEITSFITTNVNTEKLTTRGVDFDARYDTSFDDLIGEDWGALRLRVRGTYLDSRKTFAFQTDPDNFTDFSGRLGLPKWRFQTSVNWGLDRIGVNYSFDWQSSQRNALLDKDNVELEPDLLLSRNLLRSGSYGTHDINITYQATDTLQLRAGVNNITDNDPPAIAEGVSTFDLIGRRFFFGARATF